MDKGILADLALLNGLQGQQGLLGQNPLSISNWGNDYPQKPKYYHGPVMGAGSIIGAGLGNLASKGMYDYDKWSFQQNLESLLRQHLQQGQ